MQQGLKQFMKTKMKNSLKNAIIIVISIGFFAIGEQYSNGLPLIKNDSLRFEVLLSNKMLNEVHLDVKFIESLEITSGRLIMLSSANQFYLLGWGGIKPVGQKVADTISAFTYTSDGLLMIVHNKALCYIDSIWNLKKLFGLPRQDMRITAGKCVIYLFDHNKDKEKYTLYALAKGGTYSEYFVVPTPIMSVIEMNQSIIFSSGNALFTFDPKNKDLKVLAVLQKGKEIKSTAVDTLTNIIYISTENTIYGLKDSSIVVITDKFAGTLRYFNDALLVFNPEKKFLIRIVGLQDKIASKTQEMKTPANVNQTTQNNTAKTNNSTIKNFYIIAGSYPTEQKANDAIADLKSKGFPDAEVVGKNSYGNYRIAYKGYATNVEAAKDLTKIKQTINPTAWILENK
jgi:hypothetical protein